MTDEPLDLGPIKARYEAATEGPWHWAGNIDTGEPYLATWIPGAGRCQVLAIGSEELSATGRKAEEVRDYASESGLNPDTLVDEWMHDSFGNVITEPRLDFATDLMLVHARERVVFEVAPEATSREAPSVYRADIVDIRHPDAQFIAHAHADVPALVAEVEALREGMHAYTEHASRWKRERDEARAIIERAHHESIAGDGRSSVVLAVVRDILAEGVTE